MSASGAPGGAVGPDGTFVLELDGAACDGHGICLLCCPDRVSLDEWGFAVVDREPIRDLATLRRAQRAVRACPAGALRLAVRRPGGVEREAGAGPQRQGATDRSAR